MMDVLGEADTTPFCCPGRVLLPLFFVELIFSWLQVFIWYLSKAALLHLDLVGFLFVFVLFIKRRINRSHSSNIKVFISFHCASCMKIRSVPWVFSQTSSDGDELEVQPCILMPVQSVWAASHADMKTEN